MLQTVSKAFFHLLAGSKTLKRIASRYGMRADGFARRFIAGESIDEAIAAAREIQASKLLVTLDYLGEAVTSIAEADTALYASKQNGRNRAMHFVSLSAEREADTEAA